MSARGAWVYELCMGVFNDYALTDELIMQRH